MTPRWPPGWDRLDGLLSPSLSLSPGPALLIHVSVLVGLHLGEPQHGVLAFPAVVMGLLPRVTAAVDGAVLGRGELLEACSQDAVQLLMLPSVGHHFVGVSAVIVALQTVEMTGTLLIGTCNTMVNVISLQMWHHLFYALMITLLTTSYSASMFLFNYKSS